MAEYLRKNLTPDELEIRLSPGHFVTLKPIGLTAIGCV
jgi:hypothetical protein